MCRNTLMYFNADTQDEIVERFHFALADRGYLFLGKAETLLTRTSLFRPIDLGAPDVHEGVDGHRRRPSVPLRNRPRAATERRTRALRTLPSSSLSVPTVVLDAGGVVVFINGAARAQFGLRARDLGATPGPRGVIPACRSSHRDQRSRLDPRSPDDPVCVWTGPDDEPRILDILVTPLLDERRAHWYQHHLHRCAHLPHVAGRARTSQPRARDGL